MQVRFLVLRFFLYFNYGSQLARSLSKSYEVPMNFQKYFREQKVMRHPGFEPGSTAWKAAILTTVLSTHVNYLLLTSLLNPLTRECHHCSNRSFARAAILSQFSIINLILIKHGHWTQNSLNLTQRSQKYLEPFSYTLWPQLWAMIDPDTFKHRSHKQQRSLYW